MQAADNWLVRVNRAIDHVIEHVGAPLNLVEVAKVAHSSPYHFHRVFKGVTGETLHTFQKRIRLERALYLMAHEPETSLTEIAIVCGFASSSDFSRSFRARYGVPPSAFDIETWRRTRRSELTHKAAGSPYHLDRLPPGENPDGFEARVRQLERRTLAYLRVTRPFEPDRVTDAYDQLVAWVERTGVPEGDWYGWMWEDPDLVPLDQCRYDAAVQVPAGTRRDDEIGVMVLDEMWVAEIELDGPIDLEQRALDWLYGTWLPRSRCRTAPWPCAEKWHGRPFAHGVERFTLTIQLPVEPQASS